MAVLRDLGTCSMLVACNSGGFLFFGKKRKPIGWKPIRTRFV